MMQTTFDGPFRAGTTGTDDALTDETLIVMRTEDGGLELLGEDVTFLLSPDDVRTLLFYGSTVELEGPGGATATIGVDPRRYALMLVLEGRVYRAPRWAITAVARGRLPAAYLQAGRHRPHSRTHPPEQRMAHAHY
jgi:hypothetical protein